MRSTRSTASGIDAATLVSDAILAYEKRDFRRALDLYGRA